MVVPASGWSCPRTCTTTGRSASRSSTSWTRAGGARRRTCGTPRRSPSSSPGASRGSGCWPTSSPSWPWPWPGRSRSPPSWPPRTSRPGSSSASRTPAGSSSRPRPSSTASASTSSAPSASCGPASAVRGTATPAPPSDHPGQFGREAVVQWRMVVADEDGPTALSAAELARAESAGATLLHTGRRWVRIDPAALRRARRRLEEHERDHERVDAITLLRLAGDGDLAGRARHRLDHGPARRAPRRAAASRSTSRDGFAGELRPYQRRGLSWLRFLATPRSGRLPGRRHGSRQDGHHARPPDWTAPARTWWSARCRWSTTGRPRRPGSCPACACSSTTGPSADAGDRRRPAGDVLDGIARAGGQRSWPRPTSSSPRTGCSPATSSTSAPWPGRRSSLDEAQSIKNPGTRAAKAVPGCCGPARSSPSPARRWRTAWPTCGRSSTPSTRGCSAAASGSATASPSRSSGTATARRRPALRRASPSRSCCAAPRPTARSCPTCRTRSSRSPGPG